MARDKVNLDIFWLRDESLEETANLPDPDALAAEIVGDLEAALEQFRAIAEDLGEEEVLSRLTPRPLSITPAYLCPPTEQWMAVKLGGAA